MKRAFFLLLILFFPAASLLGQGLQEVQRGLEEELQRALTAEREAIRRIKQERKRLRGDLSRLTEEVASLEAEVMGLQKRFVELRGELQRLRREQTETKEEVEELSGVIEAAAKGLEEIFRRCPSTAEVEGRFQRLNPLLQRGHIPSLEEIRTLVELFFEAMELSGQVVKRKGPFLSTKGRWTEGEILRLGEFTTYWRRAGELGVLVYEKENGGLLALAGRLPWTVRRAMRNYMEGRGEVVYLDPSGGTALRYVIRRPDLLQHLRSGGPIVIPILLIGLAAAVLAAERLLFFRRIRSLGDEVKGLLELAERGRWEQCQQFLRERIGQPSARVLLAGFRERGGPQEVIEAAMEEAISQEETRLSRFLPALRVLAAIAPLLGLLGTVTGIINTFRAITLFGTGDPRMMAAGISEALVTTQVGLAVAIPVMLLHTYFHSKAERLLADAEEKARLFLPLLRKRDGLCR